MDDSGHDERRKGPSRTSERRSPRERRSGPGRRIWIRRDSAEDVADEKREGESERRTGEPRRDGDVRRGPDRRKGDRRLD